MKKFLVRGSVTVYVAVEVKADDENSAIEKAELNFQRLVNYVGKGSYDKLIGVPDIVDKDLSNAHIEECDDIVFEEAEERSGNIECRR